MIFLAYYKPTAKVVAQQQLEKLPIGVEGCCTCIQQAIIFHGNTAFIYIAIVVHMRKTANVLVYRQRLQICFRSDPKSNEKLVDVAAAATINRSDEK
jgi:hypothetical protein